MSGTIAQRVRNVVPWVLLALAVGIQVEALYAPDVPGPALFTGADKVIHVLLFGVPATIALLGPVAPRLVLPALLLHAPVSEVVQASLLPGRSGDPWDAAADLVGVLLAVAAVRTLGRRRGGVDPRRPLID